MLKGYIVTQAPQHGLRSREKVLVAVVEAESIAEAEMRFEAHFGASRKTHGSPTAREVRKHYIGINGAADSASAAAV